MSFERQVIDFLTSHEISVKQQALSSGNAAILYPGDAKVAVILAKPGKEIRQGGHGERTVIMLWEDLWITRKEIVCSRLLALLGKTERIHARETEVVRLNKEEASAFLQESHLQGSTSAYYKYGLLYKGRLCAVATFSKSRVMHDGPVYYRSYELERYANKLYITVVGGLGKLLNHFIEQHDPAHLMTYSDNDWGKGKSYRLLGFKEGGQIPGQEFEISTVDHKRMQVRFPGETDLTGSDRVSNSGSTKWIMDRRTVNA